MFGNTNIGIWDHNGKSTYHSLQTQFISRFGRGSQFQASYTLSRSRANLALTDSGGGLAGEHDAARQPDPDLDWGRPETGRDAHLQRLAHLDAADARGPARASMRAVFGDWEIATIVGAGTGQPLTVFTRARLPGLNGGPSGTGYTDNQRAEPRHRANRARASERSRRADHQPERVHAEWLPARHASAPRERGDCTGPGYFQTDLAFYKNFPLRERREAAVPLGHLQRLQQHELPVPGSRHDDECVGGDAERGG